MRKRIAMILAATMLAAVVSGCGQDSGSGGSDEQKLKDTLVIATNEDPPSLDPRAASWPEVILVGAQIFDTLVGEEPDGTITPRLAKEWEFLDDTTLRMYLRDDVYFHNGVKFTSEDVLYSLQRTMEDSVSASTFEFIDMEGTKTVDEYTIDIKMNRPYAPVFNILSGLGAGRAFIGCKQAIEEMGEAEYARNPIGTGPYKFVEWKTGTEIVLVRNDDYWDGPAKTENVILKVISEEANRVIELETGDIDFAYDITASDVQRVDDLDNCRIEMAPSPRYTYIAFSMQDELLQNKDLRYALSYAIDKEALVDACYGSAGQVATGMYSDAVFGFKENSIPYDLDKAKELMKKAGYENGLELTFLVNPGGEMDQMAEIIQNMWAQIGVKSNIMVMDCPTFEGQGNKYQISLSSGSANEPSSIFIIYTPAFGRRLQANDEKLAAMIEDAQTIYDLNEREKAYQEIQDYLFEIRFSVPLSFTPTIYGLSDKVQGFKAPATPDLINIKDMYVYE